MTSFSISLPCRILLLSIGFQAFHIMDAKAQLQWTQIEGVYSGEVTNMLTHPASNDIVLTTERKIYKWYESNRTWKPLRMNIGFDPVIEKVSAGSADDVYFGWANKVFYSQNFGETWMSQDIFSAALGSIVSICGTENGRVMAVASTLQGVVIPEIYLSTDRAFTWTSMSSDIHFFPNSIIYDEQNEVFIAGTSKGVWKSSDNGVTWTSMNQGPLDVSKSVRHVHIVKNTGTLLAATLHNVFRSDNNGQSWSEIPGNMLSWGGFDDDGAGNIYRSGETLGLYVSTDDGLTWDVKKEVGMPPVTRMIKVGNNATRYISGKARAGLLRYDENVEQWVQIGVPEYAIRAIYPIPNSDVLLLATDDSLFRSPDKGMTWQRNNTGIDHPFFSGLGQYGNEVVAMSVFNGFYFSSDQGQTWANSPGSFFGLVNDMVTTNSNRIFVTSFNEILMSPNKGMGWLSYMQGLPAQASPNNIAFVQRQGQPGYLYCDGSFGKVYRTLINGVMANWQPYHSGLPEGSLFNLVGSLDKNTLVAYSFDKMFKTSTLTDQWVTVSHPTPGVGSLNSLLAIDHLRWIAGTENGIYYSTNGGESWQISNEGLLDVRIRSLQVNQDGLVMAGTEDGGLHYSEGLLTSITSPPIPKKEFSLWPNPAYDYLIAQGVDMNANVWYASDVLGRKIRLKSDRYHDAIRLDINELSPGFWWIFAADFSGKLLLKN